MFTLSDIKTVQAFAEHQGDYAATARALGTTGEKTQNKIAVIARKIGIGYRERTNAAELAQRLLAAHHEIERLNELKAAHQKKKTSPMRDPMF